MIVLKLLYVLAALILVYFGCLLFIFLRMEVCHTEIMWDLVASMVLGYIVGYYGTSLYVKLFTH